MSITAGVLCGILAGTVGFSVAPPDFARGGAFPCQGHGCGCRSAEQCWFGCCCMTAGQRLAWAKRHGVTPPEGCTLLADIEVQTQPREAEGTTRAEVEHADCCAGSSCCAAHEKQTCCQVPAKKVATRDTAAKPTDDGTPAWSCPVCGGVGHWWVAAGQPLALPERPLALTPPSGSEPVLLAGASSIITAAPPAARPG